MKICGNSPILQNFSFREEIDFLVSNISNFDKKLNSDYLNLLGKPILTENEELVLLDFAFRTIKEDVQLEYSAIRFFKKIIKRMKVDKDRIIASFPEIEQFLEEDNIRESYLDNLSSQYLKDPIQPKYEILPIFNIGFPVEE